MHQMDLWLSIVRNMTMTELAAVFILIISIFGYSTIFFYLGYIYRLWEEEE